MKIKIVCIILLFFSMIGVSQNEKSFLHNSYQQSKSLLFVDTLDSFNYFYPIDYTPDTITVCNDTICEMVISGLDCSLWQNRIRWEKIDPNFSFVFIKATQSLRVDPNFFNNWNNCNLIKGAYHFFNPNINGVTQAKHFLSVVPIKKGNLPPVIDVEYYYSYWRYCNKWTAAKNLRLMLEYLEKETGVKPIIYTNCGFWNHSVSPYIKFNPAEYYLWIANYTTSNSPCIPKGWEHWTFWQYTHKGKIDHHTTYWDLNYFNGSDLTKILIK